MRLIPPVPFSEGVLVYGLSDAMVSRLRADDELMKAIQALLQITSAVSLEKESLFAIVFNKRARESKEAVTFYLRAIAVRLETLVCGPLNSESGNGRLTRPYLFLMCIPSLVFGLCLAGPVQTLRPVLVGQYGLMLSIALAIAMFLYVIPASLRRHALGGAVASIAVTATLAASLFLGPSIAILMNTVAGERFLPAQQIRVTGTVYIRHGKHMSCWLHLDAPSTTIAPGMTLAALPLTCGEAHYRADPMSRSYDVEVNPGLLGAPFVQSIHAVDAQAASQR